MSYMKNLLKFRKKVEKNRTGLLSAHVAHPEYAFFVTGWQNALDPISTNFF